MTTYILTHNHRYGQSLFPFQSEKEFSGFYEDENTDVIEEFGEILTQLEVDYDNDRGEWIEFIEVDLNDLTTIK